MSCIDILTIIGSVGLFLYGMKLMSEGLQKIAGDSFHDVLAKMTKNRVTGMLTGILTTSLVQSSSATTVMIVSFVNAGLVTLAESMAVIMGVNVGTTATTWIIAFLGFKFDVFYLILPLIAFSLPLFQSNQSKKQSWSEFILGFALLFMGIGIMEQFFPAAEQFPATYDFISTCCSWGILSVLLFTLIGILLTMALQASTATVSIAMLLCTNDWLPYTIGCALIIGSNIGTCIMPLLATRNTSIMAKRAAFGHLLFNIVGAVWSLILFFPFCRLLESICMGIGIGDLTATDSEALGLALFHSAFNLVNLCILLPLIKPFVQIVTRFIPDSETQDESFKLQFISSGLTSSGELALVQVRKETSRYGDETYKMFQLVKEMIAEPLGSDKQHMLHDTIQKMEEESDRAEMEIADFMNKISPKTLSVQGEQLSRNLYKIVDELESIADSLFHISATLLSKSEQRVRFSAELNTDMNTMVALTNDALCHMTRILSMDDIPSNALNKAYNIEDEINNFRNHFRNSVLDQFDRQEVEFQQSTYFMMIINECEKIGDYVINVVTAACEK